MPPGTQVHIEVNENMVPCNMPEFILLGSYLWVVAKNPILAPISFSNWCNKGMKPFKNKMLAEVEAEHWDSRPIEEIMEAVPIKAHACEMLAEEGLMPKDRNLEAYEKVFKAIMGPEHPARVRIQGFGVTPRRYFFLEHLDCRQQQWWKYCI
ncbi:hypothetical protein IEQ34_010297 [Dendrobium chrysotoxum]|uniref:Uncharacterized protein n=1 Tax=Dendrobium chrysotoxum TaxID=161865 RepID=A0AAV7H4D3_DENCH|nr:hypothetical protein IEQ34_010297 [Dendrobium chrysotoxum]